MRRLISIITIGLGIVAGSTWATIPRHAVMPFNLVDEANSLLQVPSPRAPRPNSAVTRNENVARLAYWTDHHNLTALYRYDKAGAVTNINYPGNLNVSYGLDQGGRLASVKDWANRTWTFSYDGANRLTGIQYPNGVVYSRGYNADGQLTNYVHSKSGTPFISRAFERNAAGIKTREVISSGLEVEQPDTWQKQTSDKADRLTGLSRRDEYVIPERWRGYTPSYNPEGQVTNINEGYQAWSSGNNLIWDDAGRLIEYTGLRQTNLWTDLPPMPSWGLNLAYDGLGERTARTDELVTRRLVVDRVGRLRVPLMETDESNTALRYYLWAPGVGLLAQIEADGTIHYVHADENGSTLAMTDSNGNVTDQFAFSPWGELLGRTGTNTTAFTFVGGGGVTWEGGALYRMGARYYDARLKRWLSADPAGLAGGANLYLYCCANPLFWVDLLGLCGETYLQNPGMSWDEQQNSVVLRATSQQQLAYTLNLAGAFRDNPGLASAMGDSPSVRSAVGMNQAYNQTMAVAGSMSAVNLGGGGAGAVGLLSSGSTTPNAGGVIRSFAQEKDQIYYRVFSESEQGRFLTATPPPSSAWAREALSLPSGNQATYIQEVLVPAGTQLQRSRALPAFGRQGGAEQFQLLNQIPSGNFRTGGAFP